MVVGHDAERVRDVELLVGARIAVNDRYAEGQSTSLAEGLHALDASSDAALTSLGTSRASSRATSGP